MVAFHQVSGHETDLKGFFVFFYWLEHLKVKWLGEVNFLIQIFSKVF